MFNKMYIKDSLQHTITLSIILG